MNSIKITMLGATSAGKTCFMLGMYAAMRQGVNGFTFTSNSMDVDLELSDMWEQLVDPQAGADRWPKPSGASNIYSFGYCYGLKRFIGFDWIDYRGAVLKDISTSDDQKVLLEYFKQSASVFMCISGELLTKSIKEREATVRSRAAIDRMNGFITTNFPDDVRPPIAIVITKSDLMIGRDTEEVIEEIKKLFNPVFTEGGKWSVMICPVTLGLELRNNAATGAIAPLNIYLPVTYAAFQAFKKELSMQQDHQLVAKSKHQELGKNWFTRLWNRSERDILRLEMAKNQEWIRHIEANMKLLVRELMQNASTYDDGKEVTLDT